MEPILEAYITDPEGAAEQMKKLYERTHKDALKSEFEKGKAAGLDISTFWNAIGNILFTCVIAGGIYISYFFY